MRFARQIAAPLQRIGEAASTGTANSPESGDWVPARPEAVVVLERPALPHYWDRESNRACLVAFPNPRSICSRLRLRVPTNTMQTGRLYWSRSQHSARASAPTGACSRATLQQLARNADRAARRRDSPRREWRARRRAGSGPGIGMGLQQIVDDEIRLPQPAPGIIEHGNSECRSERHLDGAHGVVNILLVVKTLLRQNNADPTRERRTVAEVQFHPTSALSCVTVRARLPAAQLARSRI